MQNITEELDKTKMYTFVGNFTNTNTFNIIDGREINCMAYRHLRLEMDSQLSAINIKYIGGYVEAWVIFQDVILDDINKIE